MKRLFLIVALCFSTLALSSTNFLPEINDEISVSVDTDVGIVKSLQLEQINLQVDLFEAQETVSVSILAVRYNAVKTKNFKENSNLDKSYRKRMPDINKKRTYLVTLKILNNTSGGLSRNWSC